MADSPSNRVCCMCKHWQRRTMTHGVCLRVMPGDEGEEGPQAYAYISCGEHPATLHTGAEFGCEYHIPDGGNHGATDWKPEKE